MKTGDRVVTEYGPGKIVGPFLSRGLRRHGDLKAEGWIVALDIGRRAVCVKVEPEPDAQRAE